MPETSPVLGRDRKRRVAAGGGGACVRTVDGRWLLDATAAGDRVILGYGWDPLRALARTARLPLLPEGYTALAELLLVADLHAVTGMAHAVLVASGTRAADSLARIAATGPDGQSGALVHVVFDHGPARLRLTGSSSRDASAVPTPVTTGDLVERVRWAIDRAHATGTPVQGIVVRLLAAVPPEAETMRRLRGLCDKHGLVLAWDETPVGLGRSGALTLLGGLPADARPDVAALGDSLVAGYGTCGALLAAPRLAAAVEQAAERWYPGWEPHPFAAAVAAEVLHHLTGHALSAQAAKAGAFLADQIEHRLADRIRTTRCGLDLQVVPLGADTAPAFPVQAVVEAARDRGLLVRATPGRASLHLTPPLTSTSEQLEAIAEHLAAAFDHACPETAHGGR